MPPLRRLLVCVAGFALLATSCTQAFSGHPQGSAARSTPSRSTPSRSTPGQSTPSPANVPGSTVPSTAPVRLVDCSRVLTGLPISSSIKSSVTVTCGVVQVPLDYRDPSGPRVPIVLTKIHSKAVTTPLGSLIVNPGGPGASGIELAVELLAPLRSSLLTHFDLVGFDPRGVSASAPLTCYSDTQFQAQLAASPDVTTASGFAAAKSEAKRFADACTSKYGSALQFYNTINTARDMDLVRQAVGDDQMNYLGFSYGTELGSVYAHLFPDKVRVAVLDGAVDPDTTGIEQTAEELKGFEHAFDQFARTCLTRSPCKDLKNPRKVAIAIEKAALKQPLPTSDPSRPLTLALANSGISEALYSSAEWTKLGNALLQASDGDGSGLLALADAYARRDASGHYPNFLQAFQIIECNDSPTGPSDATIRSTAEQWAKQFPIMGLPGASSLFTCQQWQPHRAIPPKPTAPTHTVVLVVGNLNDPATPYRGAKDMTADLGNAELLTWNGTGHTSYLGGSSCVDQAVNSYLISEKLPPEGTTCPRR